MQEEEEDAAPKMVEEEWHFRCRMMAFMGKGGSLEDCERDLQDVAQYEGLRNAEWLRDDAGARVVMPNGDVFMGRYAADIRDGLGMYLFQNGAAYAGHFAEGRRLGKGVMVMPDASKYYGQFMKDKYEGRGCYYYPDGSLYMGTWKNGLRHGQGTYWYPGHDSCLRGEWKEGFLQGSGVHEKLRHQSVAVYERGVPSGEAVFVLSHEDRIGGLRFFAADHVLRDHGPSLKLTGAYEAPPKNPEEAEPEPDEDGNLPRYDPAPLLDKVGFRHVTGSIADHADVPFPEPELELPVEIPSDVLMEAEAQGTQLNDLIPDPPAPEPAPEGEGEAE